MGVVFTLMFIPIILAAQLCLMVEAVVGALARHDMVVNVVVAGLLVINAVILVWLLVKRSKWKKKGYMEKEYLRRYRDWSYLWRFWFKFLLILGPIWQVLMVLLCVIYLVTQPLQYFASMI